MRKWLVYSLITNPRLLFFQNLVLLFKIQRQLKFLRKYFLINKNALKFFWYPAKVDIWITFYVLGKEFYKSSLYPWYNKLSWNSIVFHFNPSTRLSLSEEQKKDACILKRCFFAKTKKRMFLYVWITILAHTSIVNLRIRDDFPP